MPNKSEVFTFCPHVYRGCRLLFNPVSADGPHSCTSLKVHNAARVSRHASHQVLDPYAQFHQDASPIDIPLHPSIFQIGVLQYWIRFQQAIYLAVPAFCAAQMKRGLLMCRSFDHALSVHLAISALQ